MLQTLQAAAAAAAATAAAAPPHRSLGRARARVHDHEKTNGHPATPPSTTSVAGTNSPQCLAAQGRVTIGSTPAQAQHASLAARETRQKRRSERRHPSLLLF